MVRILNNKLVIEITCNNETPLEKLTYMQSGLLNLISVIDHADAPRTEVQDGLAHLKDLLKETLLTPIQSSLLHDKINSDQELQKNF
jgi:hypothetical protein